MGLFDFIKRNTVQVPSVPADAIFLAPEKYQGQKRKYYYTNVEISLFPNLPASFTRHEIKRGHIVELKAPQLSTDDPNAMAVYWNGTDIGLLPKSSLRGMVHRFQEANQLVLAVVSQVSRNQLLLELGFYGDPDAPAIDEKQFQSLKECFIAFDVETTGLHSVRDRIIEISAVVFRDFKPCEAFSTLINPCRPIPEESSGIHHIRDSDVVDAPKETEAMQKFSQFVGNKALNGEIIFVAHNASFDAKFLERALKRAKIEATPKYMDTLAMCKHANLDLKDNKLGTVAKHFGIRLISAHRAEDDARACGEVFVRLLHPNSVK